MTYQAEVEFVCYHEGGLIDLQRAMDEYLPQTLVKLPPDDESFRTYREPNPANFGSFHPDVRPVELHHAAEDLLTQTVNRFTILQRALESEQKPVERAELVTEPIARDHLPQPVMRTATALPMRQSQRSFHDMLVVRSRERQEARKKELQAIQKRWRNTLRRTAIEILIFSGTVALGAGTLALYRGFTAEKVVGVVIASSLAVASIVIVVKLPRQGTKSLPNPS